MLQAMRGKGIETYATYTSDEEREALPKECVALRIPHFKSKFKYASIKEVRSIIKKYRIDVIYASSSIDLSIALFASWGTPALPICIGARRLKSEGATRLIIWVFSIHA